MKLKAFKTAVPYTIPICLGFIFLGMSYGIFMNTKGFSPIYTFFMSICIFAGSMEFITVNLLLSAFNPLYAFFLTLMVNARHLFYGLSMLEKYKNVGAKKLYLIYAMCDESFTINCSVTPKENVDKGWFMFFVTLINQIFWVTGSTLGALVGMLITFNTKGIEFVMTALFLVMFLNQWDETDEHIPALIGVITSVICLFLFGKNYFLLPAMGLMLVCFSLSKNKIESRGKLK